MMSAFGCLCFASVVRVVGAPLFVCVGACFWCLSCVHICSVILFVAPVCPACVYVICVCFSRFWCMFFPYDLHVFVNVFVCLCRVVVVCMFCEDVFVSHFCVVLCACLVPPFCECFLYVGAPFLCVFFVYVCAPFLCVFFVYVCCPVCVRVFVYVFCVCYVCSPFL